MKKVSLFVLCCFIPAVANSSSNIDVGEKHKTENARQTEVQPVVNSEINPKLPNTDEKTAFMPNINSRNENGWGEQKHEPFTAKKFRLFKDGEKKRPIKPNEENNENTFYNCPVSSDKKYCLPEKGELNKDIGVILRKGKSTIDADGFITDLQPPVLYNERAKDFEKYFYRFWNNNVDDCKNITGQTSCWSPSYPLVCNSAFNFANFKNFETDKNGAEKARHYFGWKDKLSGTINNTYTTEDDYKIHVFMAPITKNNFGRFTEDHDKGIFTALSPTGWKKNGECLDPEFDYDLVHTDTDNKDNTTTETLVVDDNNSSLSEPKKVKTGGQILPCGSFSDNSKYKGKGFKEIATTACPTNYYSIGNASSYNYDVYKIHMPLSTKFTESNSLKNKNNYDLQNSSKEMKTRICGTCDDIDHRCTEIVRGVLYEKCSKDGNKFKCDAGQLDKVVSRLKFDNPGNFTGMFNGNKISGFTNKPLQCLICLHNLDSTLAELLI